MDKTVLIWCVIVTILIGGFIVRELCVHFHRPHFRHNRKGRLHVFGVAKEREILFCPGDETDDNEDCDD